MGDGLSVAARPVGTASTLVAPPRGMFSLRRLAPLLVFTALLAGCAGAGPSADVSRLVPGPVEEPLSESDIHLVSTLIAISDRRLYDSATMSAAAVSPEARIRRQVALAAARIGGSEARALARHLLLDADSAVAAAAAFAIGELADTSAVPVLSDRLTAPDSTSNALERAEVAEALGKIGDEAARAALRGYLLTADSVGAVPAVVGAALIGGWRSGIADSAPFIRWTSAPDPEIRWRAAYALTRRRFPDAVPILRSLLADADARVRAMALRGVQRPVLEQAGVPVQEVAGEVMPLIGDTAYEVRVEAVRALATYGSGPALDAVMGLAASPDSTRAHERAAAIEALGRAGPLAAPAATLLVGVALDPGAHTFHREMAVDALPAIDPSVAMANIPILLGNEDWRLRAAAGRALGGSSGAAVSLIAQAVRDSDPRVGAATLLAISEREDSASIRPLRSLLVEALGARDIYMRANATLALARIADPAHFPNLLDAYDVAQGDSVPDARLAAIDAIAALKERGVPFPERVFFARFRAPDDYLTRQRAVDRFPAESRGAWLPPFPLERGADAATIESIVRRYIAPAGADSLRPRIRIETNRGDLVIELFAEDAPLTVANFLGLVRDRFFDGQEWPRVVPDFVVQGGDPRGDTSGGPSWVIRDEMNTRRYTPGTFGMALAGPDTGSSQFFITHSDQPHLDGTYTVFGRLLSGYMVLEQLLVGDELIRVTEISAPAANE